MDAVVKNTVNIRSGEMGPPVKTPEAKKKNNKKKFCCFEEKNVGNYC